MTALQAVAAEDGGSSGYWCMRSDVHDFNVDEIRAPYRRSHQLVVPVHLVSA